MNDISSQGRFAPPQAHVEDVQAPVDGLQLASRSSRFWAAMLDGVIAMALMGLVAWSTPWNPFEQQLGFWEPNLGGAAIGFGLFMLCHGYLLAKRGQTIGKMALKIRIARSDGSAASLGRLIGLRYGPAFVFSMLNGVIQLYYLIDTLMIFNNARRCLHDYFADTVVLKV